MRIVMAIAGVTATFASATAQQHVDGYTRQNGTYVAPHYRSAPDSSRTNNWSSQGNVNPYTGQQGTHNPYQPPQPTYTNPYTNNNNLNSYGRMR